MPRSLENLPVDHPLEHRLVVMEDEVHSITSLQRPFLDSDYSEHQRNNKPRFHQYISEDAEKFVELLGPDVDPMQHGSYQARTVAIPLVDAQRGVDGAPQLSTQEEQDYVAWHTLHDDHEGFSAYKRLFARRTQEMQGDVLLVDMTPEIAALEANEWDTMIARLFGEAPSRRFRAYAADSSPGNFNAHLRKIGERIGYMYTAFRAFEIGMEHDDLTEDERKNFLLMGHDVTFNHFGEVEAARGKIILADQLLAEHDVVITAICKQFQTTREVLRKREGGYR